MSRLFDLWHMAHGAWSGRHETAMRSALCALPAREVLS